MVLVLRYVLGATLNVQRVYGTSAVYSFRPPPPLLPRPRPLPSSLVLFLVVSPSLLPRLHSCSCPSASFLSWSPACCPWWAPCFASWSLFTPSYPSSGPSLSFLARLAPCLLAPPSRPRPSSRWDALVASLFFPFLLWPWAMLL